MRCTSHCLIGCYHLWREFDTSLSDRIEPFLYLAQFFVVEDTSPDNIELTGGTALFRIDIITLTSHRHHTTSVKYLG